MTINEISAECHSGSGSNRIDLTVGQIYCSTCMSVMRAYLFAWRGHGAEAMYSILALYFHGRAKRTCMWEPPTHKMEENYSYSWWGRHLWWCTSPWAWRTVRWLAPWTDSPPPPGILLTLDEARVLDGIPLPEPDRQHIGQPCGQTHPPPPPPPRNYSYSWWGRHLWWCTPPWA